MFGILTLFIVGLAESFTTADLRAAESECDDDLAEITKKKLDEKIASAKEFDKVELRTIFNWLADEYEIYFWTEDEAFKKKTLALRVSVSATKAMTLRQFVDLITHQIPAVYHIDSCSGILILRPTRKKPQ